MGCLRYARPDAGPNAAHRLVDSCLVRCEPNVSTSTTLQETLKHQYNDNVCVICVDENVLAIFVLNTVYYMECRLCFLLCSFEGSDIILCHCTNCKEYILRFAKIQSSRNEGNLKRLLVAPCFTQEVDKSCLVRRWRNIRRASLQNAVSVHRKIVPGFSHRKRQMSSVGYELLAIGSIKLPPLLHSSGAQIGPTSD